MTRFEDALAAELVWLLRAGVPTRAVRLTVREHLVMRLERGPLGAREVEDTVEATVRAACRLVWDLGAPEDVVETVCRAALEAVRGHGGASARWLPEATHAAFVVLDEVARERASEPTWGWLVRQLPSW